MVIWITGLSGAGKTTLGQALYGLLKPRLPELVLLDGDVIRTIFGAGLGYSEEHRRIQIKRLQGMAKVLSEQGLAVVVAALYAQPDLLRWNRRKLNPYFEIYLKAPLALLHARDSKGLYAAAAAGEMEHVVGVDIPWHEPLSADMTIDAARAEMPSALAHRVALGVPRLAAALPQAAE